MADPPFDPADLAGWLTLVGVPGIGPATCRALLAAFGLPRDVLAAPRARLREVVPASVVVALTTPPDDARRTQIARTLAWAAEPGRHILTLADPRYPVGLLEISDPPPVLYVSGRVERLAAPAVAIVGSRNATPQGLVDARRFAEALARAGLTVVSGLALGIDGAAHEGALAASAASASTIAVVGTGLDLVYPAAHRELAHRIAEVGALVSDFPLGTGAAAHHFPRRNRLIAGLARGVLVVEAAPQSGSLITARLAAEYGRDVFAVPGSIHSPLSKGCHRLIREGAKLVEAIDDLLEEWPDLQDRPGAAIDESAADDPDDPDDPDAQLLTEHLGFGPVAIDDLARSSGWPPHKLAALLLELEMRGRISRLPGGRIQRLAR